MVITFKLYESDGTTLVYTFPVVFEANYPHSEKSYIEHSNIRGQGSLIVDAGDSPWDLTLRGVLSSADYAGLIDLIDDMETDVALNTRFYLKISKGDGTFYSYKVKRITPIEWENNSLRTNFIEYQVTFRVLSW